VAQRRAKLELGWNRGLIAERAAGRACCGPKNSSSESAGIVP